MGSLCNC